MRAPVTLLLKLLPRDLRESVAGDIEEEYAAIAARRGRIRAVIWAWTTALRLAVAFRVERVTHVRSVPPIGEELRTRPAFWDALRQDVTFSLRMLRTQPAFTAVALVALMLGIGANTAIFSVVDAILWRPLPYADADRIMSLAEQRPREGRLYGAVSPADFYDWRRDARSFSEMAAISDRTFNLTGTGDPERILALTVTSGFFEALRITPALGRTFNPDEETVGRHRVTLLTDAIWRRRFAADRHIVGRTVSFDGNRYEVVGVLPTRFWWPAKIDVVVPLALDDHDRRLRSAHFLDLVARLRPGVSESQAREELNVIGARLAQTYPDDNKNHGPSLRPFREALVGEARTALLVLLGAVGCVLLIACANVATLFLARATGRQKELTVRRAVGATRARVVRQMLTESLVISLIGGGAGVLLAAWSLAALRAVLPAQFSELPGIDHIGLDGRMLAAAIVLSLAAGVLFGVLPALVASDQRISATLNEQARGATGGARTRRLRAALLVAELACSLVLLTGAALLIVSFKRLVDVSPGFRAEQLVLVRLSLPASRYGDQTRAVAFYESVMDRLRTVPGVQRVAAASAPPFGGDDARLDLEIEHRTWELQGPVRAHPRLVSPDYFSTLGIPLVHGRTFDDHDSASAPLVAIVNETAVRRFWPAGDPIGQRISMGSPTRWMEVVGVVGDIRHEALNRDAEPEGYIPQRQGFNAIGVGLNRALSLLIRTTDGVAIASTVRSTIAALDPQQPIGSVRAMDDLVAESVAPRRLNFVLLSAFALVALALTAAGLYGVMSYVVAQRTREIGVRMALGATPGSVVRMVLAEAGVLTIAGIGVGIIGALVLTRSMTSLLFGVSAADPAIYAGVSILLASVAMLAAAAPSSRATRIDPLIALRD
jgi:predicted permease